MCVFCKIANNEVPAYTIYEDDDFIAFLDISQATIGHTLIVPKKHYPNIYSLDDVIAGKLGKLSVLLANHLKEKLKTDHMNIITNAGELAGQTVNHFHLHLIPRYINDGMIFKFNRNELSEKEFKKLHNLLKK